MDYTNFMYSSTSNPQIPCYQSLSMRGVYSDMVKIREIRKAKGISGTQLAEKMKTDSQLIYRYEKGETELTLSKAKEFAKALGVTPAEVFGISNPVAPAADSASISIVAAIAAHTVEFAAKKKINPATLHRIIESAVADSAGKSLEEAIRITDTIIKHELRHLASTKKTRKD